MKHNEAHATQHALVNALHDGIVDLVVGHVAPPDEHVRGVEDIGGQPMLRLIQGGGAYLIAVGSQPVCNCAVDTLGVDSANGGAIVFVTILVPNGHA